MLECSHGIFFFVRSFVFSLSFSSSVCNGCEEGKSVYLQLSVDNSFAFFVFSRVMRSLFKIIAVITCGKGIFF